MSGEAGRDETAAFAERLRDLKERSGLSYGTLAKRLHMSTSTLHRYCNGDAVPTDYAAVERFARLCKASPDELVEVHRAWVVADAVRGRKAAITEPVAERVAERVEPVAAEAVPVAPQVPGETGAPSAPEVPSEPGEPQPSPRARRRALYVAGGVLAVVGAVVLSTRLLPPGPDAAPQAHGSQVTDAPSKSPSPDAPSASPSKTPSPRASRTTEPTPTGAPSPSTSRTESSAPPVTVATRPYAWEGPCTQSYLVNRPSTEVPPPPGEQDARGWVRALGGVSADEQYVALTVQGTGGETVVLEALHVRVVKSGPPLVWNDYEMGVGCGGGVRTASFDIALDSGHPSANPLNGQRDFPYKVSESDPEVFYITANARARDVSWYLELDWSSGTRRGTVRIDDSGLPFRTSASKGTGKFNYPLGGASRWETAPVQEEQTP
ncbi:helix-turn-helix domain-containing protein [Streptomyces sp. NPDC058001]|uniref:helix-turn-helix domain-containing protein n=1 Tax=Streptomyces sp. NPDC058001 TaxID=3346300 RepID=UPI0036EBC3E3